MESRVIRRRFNLIGAVLLALSVSNLAHSDVLYRFVDKDGVVHFTNSPSDPRFEIVRESYFRNRARVISLRSRRRPAKVTDSVLNPLIADEAKKQSLPAPLIKAVIRAESNFNAKAVSHKGAQGLMQLMPATAESLGVKDAFDPKQNVQGGTRYLRKMLDRFRNLAYALAAYNAGPDAVERYGGVPPYAETQQYVKRVMAYYRDYYEDFSE